MRYGTFLLLLIFHLNPTVGLSDRAELSNQAQTGVNPSLAGKEMLKAGLDKAISETKDEGEKKTYEGMKDLVDGQKALEQANQRANQNSETTCQGKQESGGMPPGAGQPSQPPQKNGDEEEKPQQQQQAAQQQVPPEFKGQIAQLPQASADTAGSTNTVNNITNSAIQAIKGSGEVVDLTNFRASR